MTHLGLGVLWVGDTSNYRSSRDCGKKLPCLWQSLLRDRYKNMYFLVWPSFFWGYDWGFLSSILHLFLLHSLDCNLSVEDHGTAASRLSQAPFGQREPLSPGCQFPYKGSHGLWHYGETHLSPKPPNLGWGACGSREGKVYIWILQCADCFSDGTSWRKYVEGRTEGVTGFHLSYHLFPSGLLLFILSLQARNSSSRSMHTRGDIQMALPSWVPADLAFLSTAWSERRAGDI